jgi:hypothetical protein
VDRCSIRALHPQFPTAQDILSNLKLVLDEKPALLVQIKIKQWPKQNELES